MFKFLLWRSRVFGFSGGEILLIAVIALILFGNDKLPDNMKKMIKGLNQAKKVAKDVQISWQDVKSDVQRSIDFEDEKKEMQALVNSVTIDLDINHEGSDYSNLIVPQEKLDEYQKNVVNFNDQSFLKGGELGSLSNESLENVNLITPEEFLMSQEFVGPRI